MIVSYLCQNVDGKGGDRGVKWDEQNEGSLQLDEPEHPQSPFMMTVIWLFGGLFGRVEVWY